MSTGNETPQSGHITMMKDKFSISRNKPQRSGWLLLLVVGLLPVVADAEDSTSRDNRGFEVSVVTDRENAVYETGEKARFIITVARDGQRIADGSVSYAVDDFITDHPTDESFPKDTVALSGKPVVVSVSSKTPRFLRCVVQFKPDGEEPIEAVAAAGFSPLKIEPSLPVPDDFDDFWAAQKAALAKIPVKSQVTPIEYKDDPRLSCFDVQVQCLGAPVSGYLAKPKDAKPGSLPAILNVHGAGVRSSKLYLAVEGAQAGLLAMDINAHGLPNGKPDKFYKALNTGRLANYRREGSESRDTYYFRGMYLRLVRAIDFLTSRPDWDGKHVIVLGHSQGGGQALVAGGIDDRVTMVAAGVPAMCDHSGRVAGRINGWPKLVPMQPDGTPDPKVLVASQYYDAVNFARKCRKQCTLSVGFVDTACPPASVYAAYNVIPGKKQIVNEPRMGHAAPKHIKAAFHESIMRHARDRQKE